MTDTQKDHEDAAMAASPQAAESLIATLLRLETTIKDLQTRLKAVEAKVSPPAPASMVPQRF